MFKIDQFRFFVNLLFVRFLHCCSSLLSLFLSENMLYPVFASLRIVFTMQNVHH